ncbi:hypothetical protein ACLN6N_13875 [Sphingomonas carotinifaciens]|uniref:hypothetical protein n=1 Tax=Sphingomonas carotinifaciens TaxID=1166323 RepID=UPI0039A1C96D
MVATGLHRTIAAPVIGVLFDALLGGVVPIQRAIGRIALAFVDPAPFSERTADAAD